ncbi:hypothetical protein [Fodinicola feengrottensis]|uniref:hypothetical protein n=1 Tax=Fodinicola feengrottensis TaxID=435914 RepID=UPI0013D7FD25|nr:hypothetical protein [Fodinicola feengrottensis]
MGEPGGSNAGGDDAFRVWTYALNCCLDDEHPPEQAGADQQALINDYVDLIVEELEADPDRLAAAAAQCRERADQDTAAGCPPHHGDVWGAYLAELGAARVRTAGADTSSRKRASVCFGRYTNARPRRRRRPSGIDRGSGLVTGGGCANGAASIQSGGGDATSSDAPSRSSTHVVLTTC